MFVDFAIRLFRHIRYTQDGQRSESVVDVAYSDRADETSHDRNFSNLNVDQVDWQSGNDVDLHSGGTLLES
jgi:hypothetical protein